MEAPVPASALIHSATLVSAGLFLILRFNFIVDATFFGKFLIPIVGSLTAAYGGVAAAAQSDLKKTLAYSTISHCGFLMILCATESSELTILYLYVHGFFKAIIFMCVGNVLRLSRGYQDTRRMGMLIKYLPFEYICITIGLYNLAGLPFTFGYVAKHLLFINLSPHGYIYTVVLVNALIGALAGIIYTYKILNYTFADFKKGSTTLYNGLNRIEYNSTYYSNSSLGSIIPIFGLFIASYIITYTLFRYLVASDSFFGDYIYATIKANYFCGLYAYKGFLINYSYAN